MPKTSGLRFRSGLNLGDIIADDDHIYGDGIGIAARLGAAPVSNERYKMSLTLGNKSGVITIVDEDVADEAAGRAQGDPSASARRGIVVGALP